MIAAAPRKNAKGERSIRPSRMGTKLGRAGARLVHEDLDRIAALHVPPYGHDPPAPLPVRRRPAA